MDRVRVRVSVSVRARARVRGRDDAHHLWTGMRTSGKERTYT